MATTKLRPDRRTYVRHIFYGTCRTTGKLRTHGYFAARDSPSTLRRAEAKAKSDLINARYVTTSRSSCR